MRRSKNSSQLISTGRKKGTGQKLKHLRIYPGTEKFLFTARMFKQQNRLAKEVAESQFLNPAGHGPG